MSSTDVALRRSADGRLAVLNDLNVRGDARNEILQDLPMVADWPVYTLAKQICE